MGPKNSTEEILKRLAEQKFALDQSSIVAQTDAKGTIEYVNDKFCEISEYNRDELIGKNHRIINSGYHPKEFFLSMWRIISKGQIWRGEICNRAKSGQIYWVATTIVPFSDFEGQPHQYLAIRQDITSLKEAEKKILEQQDQLIANSKLSAIGEMASAITHEINNPLGVILGRCEMIKDLVARGQLNMDNFLRLVDAIDLNGKRIEKIVKSMKALAHQGEDDPMIKTSLYAIVQDLKDLVGEKFRSHGIKLHISDVSKDFMINCRSHEIMQVLVNLLNNSFDAISQLPEKWINFEIISSEDEVRILITDSGPGIPKSIQEKLFMPFIQLRKYSTELA